MMRSFSDPIITIEQSGYQPTHLSQAVRASNFFLSLVLLIAFIVFNHYHHHEMMQTSTTFSESLLDRHFNLLPWAWFFTIPVYGLSMGAPYFGLFMLRRKPDALALFFIALLAKGVGESVKMIPADTRPCFLSQTIADKGGCSCSYGQPSGHTSNTLVFYLLLYPLFFRDFRGSTTTKRIFIALMAFLALNVGLSRIWYGAHSFNQVILGALIGWAIFSGHLFLRRRIKILLIETLAWRKHLPLGHRLIFWIIFLVFLAINLSALAMWDYRRTWEMSAKPHPLIGEICFQKCLGKGGSLADRHLGSIAMMNGAMFVALGFALGWGRLTISSDDYYRDSWKSPMFALRRLLAISVVMTPTIVSWVPGIATEGLNLWLVTTALSVAFALMFFWGAPKIFHSFGVELPGDFFSPLCVRSFGQYEMPEVVLMRDVSSVRGSSLRANSEMEPVIT